MAFTLLADAVQEQDIKYINYQPWTKLYSPAEVESIIKRLVPFRNEQVPTNATRATKREPTRNEMRKFNGQHTTMKT
eukprot:8141100-Heterocapsa_arctica.AAC.1